MRAVNTANGLGAQPRELTNVNGRLYYVGQSEVGNDLWTSDGTSAGTQLVNDFQTSSDYIRPRKMTNANGQLFFTIFDPTIGFELWTSGGTAATTKLFKEFERGGVVDWKASRSSMALCICRLMMAAAGSCGKSDGTLTGTSLVRELARANRNSLYAGGPSGINLNGTLYFFSNDYSGYSAQSELWKTDGTSAGTEVVKALPPGSNSTADIHRTLTNLNGTLYFVAGNQNRKPALWKSDGTSAGTVPIVELTKRPLP